MSKLILEFSIQFCINSGFPAFLDIARDTLTTCVEKDVQIDFSKSADKMISLLDRLCIELDRNIKINEITWQESSLKKQDLQEKLSKLNDFSDNNAEIANEVQNLKDLAKEKIEYYEEQSKLIENLKGQKHVIEDTERNLQSMLIDVMKKKNI